MTVIKIIAPPTGAIGAKDPSWVVADLVTRQSRRGAAIWGVVFGLFVISTIKAFVSGYPTLTQRIQLARSLQSFSMFLGLPHHAETVPGFTSWRVLTAIVVIGAIWGLLTSTALLRGEEEAGRWEVLLAGQTTKARATARALLGLGRSLGMMFLLTALLTLAAGRLPGARFTIGGSLLFAVAMVSGAAMFLAIGALASQLSATRGQASTISAAVLGGSYIVRMVADSSTALGWLRWLSPIGWVEELRPLRDTQPIALLPIAGLVLACSGLAIWFAGRRDLGASVLRERDGHGGNPRWLLGPTTLALRLSRPSALAWLIGVSGMAVVYGSLTRSATNILSSSPAITATLGRFGIHRATEGYLGIVFFMASALIALVAAGQIAAIRGEEATGRLDNLLVRPVSRTAWLAGRVGVSLAIVLLAGGAAGFFTWIGASSQRLYQDPPTLLQAGLNAAVPGVFVLGAGVLVLGVRPRLAGTAAYGIVAWSFLVDLLGSLVKGSTWLRDSSLFSHIALAPSAKPDWGTDAIIVGLGMGAAIIGAIAFQRRDVEYL